MDTQKLFGSLTDYLFHLLLVHPVIFPANDKDIVNSTHVNAFVAAQTIYLVDKLVKGLLKVEHPRKITNYVHVTDGIPLMGYEHRRLDEIDSLFCTKRPRQGRGWEEMAVSLTTGPRHRRGWEEMAEPLTTLTSVMTIVVVDLPDETAPGRFYDRLLNLIYNGRTYGCNLIVRSDRRCGARMRLNLIISCDCIIILPSRGTMIAHVKKLMSTTFPEGEPNDNSTGEALIDMCYFPRNYSTGIYGQIEIFDDTFHPCPGDSYRRYFERRVGGSLLAVNRMYNTTIENI
jgi:hypothetical protein